MTEGDLFGRDSEIGRIAALTSAARRGLSGAAILRGGAGVGKTALLGRARLDAPDLHHVHLAAVEAESGFAFAGLQRLIGPFPPEVDQLPPPQQSAVDVAFGRSSGPAADPYLVGLATLNVLASLAARRPVLVTIDDAHWLDRESLVVIGFAARRLDAEGVALVAAARPDEVDLSPFDGIDAIDIAGLDREAALALLGRVVEGPLDARVADRVVHTTAGNALALCDLGAGLSASHLDGSERLPESMAVGSRLELHYARMVDRLDESTRTWLLVAALDTSGEVATVGAAARHLGVGDSASTPAEQIGIITVREVVEFRHPLVRAAAYAAASNPERRAAHGALAAVISETSEPDRHVAHLAAAASQPEESVALALVVAAERARARGGLAACAELLESAAALTPDRLVAAERLLESADASLGAGEPRRCIATLDRIAVGELDPLRRARARLIRAECVGLSGEEAASAQMAAECLGAAVDVGPLDPGFTLDALAEACQAAMIADRLIVDVDAGEIGRTTRELSPQDGSLSAQMVAAFAAIPLDGYEAAIPLIRSATVALLDPATPDDEVLRRHLLGFTLCSISLDHASTFAVQQRVERIARETGALRSLDYLLFAMSMTATLQGRLDDADAYLEEGVQLHSVLSQSSREFDIYRHPELAAMRLDDRAAFDEMLRVADETASYMGHGAVAAVCDYGRITVGLSCGEYAMAKEAGLRLVGDDGFAMHTRALPDLVEAAVRDGDLPVAERALALLRERAAAADTPFGSGVLARSEALLAPDSDAEESFLDALELLADGDSTVEVARSHLVYGEWLRRQRRGLEARTQLGVAHETFAEMGATGYAARAERELTAAGGRSGRRRAATSSELTGQERQIAKLAGDGLTNAEIAARLYVSSPTVDYHLRKVFRKLDIGSRRQLRGRSF